MDYEARGPAEFEEDYSTFDLFKQQDWEAPQAHRYDPYGSRCSPLISFDAKSEPAFTPIYEAALG